MADGHEDQRIDAPDEPAIEQSRTTKAGLPSLAVAGAELRQGRGSLPDSAHGPSPGTPTLPWETGFSRRATLTESGLPSITEIRQDPREPGSGLPPLPTVQTAAQRFDNNEEESPVEGPSFTLSRRALASSVSTVNPVQNPTQGLDGTGEPSPLSSPIIGPSAKGKQKENWPLSTYQNTTRSKSTTNKNVASSTSIFADIDAISRAPTPEAEPDAKISLISPNEELNIGKGVRFQETTRIDDDAFGSTLTPANSSTQLRTRKSETWYPPRKVAAAPQGQQGPQWPPKQNSTDLLERIRWRRYQRNNKRAAEVARKRASPNARSKTKNFKTRVAAASQEAVGRLGDVLAEVSAKIRSSSRPPKLSSDPGRAPRSSEFSLRSWRRRTTSEQQPPNDTSSLEPLVEPCEPESSKAGARRETVRKRFFSFSKASDSSGQRSGPSSELQPPSRSDGSTGTPREANMSIPSEWLPTAKTFNEYAKRTGVKTTFVDVQPEPSQAASGSRESAENVLKMQQHAESQRELEEFQQQLDESRRQQEGSRQESQQGQEAASGSNRLRLPGTIVRSNSDWRRKTLISLREVGRWSAHTHERGQRRRSESDLLSSRSHGTPHDFRGEGIPRDFRGDTGSLLTQDSFSGRLGMISADQQIDVTDAQIRATARSRELAAMIANSRTRISGPPPSGLQPPMEDPSDQAGLSNESDPSPSASSGKEPGSNHHASPNN